MGSGGGRDVRGYGGASAGSSTRHGSGVERIHRNRAGDAGKWEKLCERGSPGASDERVDEFQRKSNCADVAGSGIRRGRGGIATGGSGGEPEHGILKGILDGGD